MELLGCQVTWCRTVRGKDEVRGSTPVKISTREYSYKKTAYLWDNDSR